MGLFRCAEGRLDSLLLSRFPSAGWSSFEDDLGGFLSLPEVSAEMNAARERAAVFALAGPTDEPTGRGSVTRWGPGTFHKVAPLLGNLFFDHCILMNDLEAANHAVAAAGEGSLRPIDGNACPPSRNRFVHLRPGTGLGMSFFSEGRSFPSEGGSAPCAFDAGVPDELALARHLRSLAGGALPTYEAALCGDGLRAISEALTGESVSPEVVTGAWPRERENSANSTRVLGLFIGLLARAAQGAALTVLPEACFLSGSIVDALPEVAWESFCGPFRHHATHGQFLSRVRLALVKGPELTLHGAALTGARTLAGC
jgi:glucokinase